MMRIYFSTMLLLTTAGMVCAVSVTSTLGLGAGLVLLSVGAGGISAGLMTRDTQPTAGVSPRKTRPNHR